MTGWVFPVRLFHSRLLAGFDRRTCRFTIRDLPWLGVAPPLFGILGRHGKLNFGRHGEAMSMSDQEKKKSTKLRGFLRVIVGLVIVGIIGFFWIRPDQTRARRALPFSAEDVHEWHLENGFLPDYSYQLKAKITADQFSRYVDRLGLTPHSATTAASSCSSAGEPSARSARPWPRRPQAGTDGAPRRRGRGRQDRAPAGSSAPRPARPCAVGGVQDGLSRHAHWAVSGHRRDRRRCEPAGFAPNRRVPQRVRRAHRRRDSGGSSRPCSWSRTSTGPTRERSTWSSSWAGGSRRCRSSRWFPSATTS